MSTKYIEVKSESCINVENLRETLSKIAKKDIIFVLSYNDIQYPSYSGMNMGHFCEVAYWQDDKIVWQTFSTENPSLIDDFITQLDDKLLLIVKRGAFAAYIGKPREEFHTVRHDLIYQDRYRFKNDGSMQFDSIFWDTKENQKLHPRINGKEDQEIVFRISFYNVDDSRELVITKDGAYDFVSVEKLKDDKNIYQEIKLEWTFCTLKVNQKYYATFLKVAGEPKLHNGKNKCKDCDNEDLASFWLLQEVIWKLSHDDDDKWPGATKLDNQLGRCLWHYLDYCKFLYSDDVGEYSRDKDFMRDDLDEMQMHIYEAYSGEVTGAEFKNFLQKFQDRVILIKATDINIIICLSSGRHIGRVEFKPKDARTTDAIVEELQKSKFISCGEGYFLPQRISKSEQVAEFFGYADSLFEGKNCEKDYESAFKIYQYLANELNERDALYYLGLYYQEGYGVVEKDIKTAIKYYEKALEAGDTQYSANNLGVIYATGNGVPQDEKKALKYYEIAMNDGDIYATASVAKIYEEGKVVERDRAKAFELYLKAEDKASYNYDVDSEFKEELKKDLERLRKELK